MGRNDQGEKKSQDFSGESASCQGLTLARAKYQNVRGPVSGENDGHHCFTTCAFPPKWGRGAGYSVTRMFEIRSRQNF